MQDVLGALLLAADPAQAHQMDGGAVALVIALQPEIMQLVLVYKIHPVASRHQQQCPLRVRLRFPRQGRQLYHAIQPVLQVKLIKLNAQAERLNQTVVR